MNERKTERKENTLKKRESDGFVCLYVPQCWFFIALSLYQIYVTEGLCLPCQVIPQAVCSRHGLAIGANFIWLVKILMVICWPISYPVGKILDHLLGHSDSALFRRAQLKAFVGIHGKEAGKGGELTHDETTIIQGALDLTEKTALDSMTPLEHTFSLDVDTKLDWSQASASVGIDLQGGCGKNNGSRTQSDSCLFRR